MVLSETALRCIAQLNEAGFSAYAVGGCVRDSLLGIPPHDYDLCTNPAASRFDSYPVILQGCKIYVAEAGLLTRSVRSAFSVTQWLIARTLYPEG